MLKKHLNIFFLFILGFQLSSQEMLQLEDAIKISLEKNYDILIAKNEKEIAKAQNNLGNAGLSPTVTANANLNFASINSHQEFSSGQIQDRPNASSNSTAGSLNASWVVFDGLRMFAVRKRLNATVQLSDLALKAQMQNTVYDVMLSYYEIVRIQKLIQAARQNLQIYTERKKIAQVKMEIGSDSKVDYLLSQSDENKAKSNLLQLELQLLAAKASLNNLLVRPVDTDFKTADTIIVNYSPALDELKKSVLSNNFALQMAKQNEFIAEQSVKEARSFGFPQIQLNGSYVFNLSQSQAGFVLVNRQNGLNGGISAGWLIFNGGRYSKLAKERQIRLLNQKYITEQSKQQLDALVYLNYQGFLANQKILELEKQNLMDSKEVQMVSLERYKIGKANLLETIETQKNLEDAQVRYIDALFNLKKAEAELLRSNGALVK
jgi:outer membrane protein TolC